MNEWLSSLRRGSGVEARTDGRVVSDEEDLHGQTLRFGGVSPVAGRGADHTQSLQQHTRGHVAAAQIRQLPRL